MKKVLWCLAALLCSLSIPNVGFAQYYGQRGYYQPRVVQQPRPPFSRDAYVGGGAVVGGVAGQRFGGPYGSAVGGGAGAYVGGKAYDVQGAT